MGNEQFKLLSLSTWYFLVGWLGRGDHPETFLLKALFCQSTPSWLKVRGGWSSRVCWCEQSGMLVAHVILVSAQVPLVLTLGLWDFGLGLDKNKDKKYKAVLTAVLPELPGCYLAA